MPTALIVEDEPEANRLLSMLVGLRGFRAESAFTGEEALEKARDGKPDVVFLDLMLPDTTGFDVCRALKTRRQTNPIPVVMVTARLADESRVQSACAGASEFIPKPYTPDQIFDALSSAGGWRRDLADPDDQDRIPIDTRDEVAPFERAQRLTSLLLARSPLAEEAVGRIDQAVERIQHEAIDWGRRRGVEHVADLSYRLEPDRLTIAVRDVGGWFAGSQRSGHERLETAIDLGGFDEVIEDHGTGEVVLIRRFEPRGDVPAA